MNISKLTEDYITDHPSIKDCLKNDIVNFSSLSRKIAADIKLGKRNFDAILIACRRFQRKLKGGDVENRILNILRRSRTEIKNKMAAIVLEKDIFFGNLLSLEKEAKRTKDIFRIIESASAITIITSEDFLDSIKKYFKHKIILENKKLAEITIKSPEDIETTPGTYAYLCSLLSENNVNIVETLSCWTDTIFLVDEIDVGKVMGLLRF